MRSIAYLASYPRSGNTYVRALLANYEGGLARPLTTQEIAHYGFGEHDETCLARASGLRAGQRTIEDAWMARRAYFGMVRELPGEGPVMFKTHNLNGSVFGLPAFDIQPGDRIVYIVRHPLDVAVSGSCFFGIEQAHMAARMLLAGATNHSDDAFWEITGSLTENVAGWLNEDRAPILLVRFEDLCAHPGRELSRILEFTGKTAVPSLVRKAVANTAFQHLQASQRTEGFDQGPGKDARATFFRDGRTNQWRTELAAEPMARLVEGLGDLIDALGYERPNRLASRLRSAAKAVAVRRPPAPLRRSRPTNEQVRPEYRPG